MGAVRKIRVAKKGGSVSFSARIPKVTLDTLKAYAKEAGMSTGAAAVQLLEEALRMIRFPGIDFRWSPSGRQAYVTGTGLTAWEMFMIWDAHKRSAARLLKNYPHLKPGQIQAGATYLQAFPEELPSLEPPPGMPVVRI